MVDVGDPAPDFTVPYASMVRAEEMDWGARFTLSEHLDEAPLVIPFFPGAFSNVCERELTTFNDRLNEFEEAGAVIYGIGSDLPYAINEFHRELGLGFDLLSDFNREAATAYDAMTDSVTGVKDINNRDLYVIDSDGVVVYKWDGEATDEPDPDEVLEAVRNA